MAKALTVYDIEKALVKNGGFVSLTAKALGVSPNAIYSRIKKSELLQRVKKEIDEAHLDLAESKLVKGIKAGEWEHVKFMLQYKGSSRGYVKSQKVENNVNVDAVGKVAEILDKLDGSDLGPIRGNDE